MKAYAVQYKDKEGFTHFAPTNDGSLPIFANVNAAQNALENIVETHKTLLQGTPEYEWFYAYGVFKKKRLVGYTKPPKVHADMYNRVLKTIHIGIINVYPQAKVC